MPGGDPLLYAGVLVGATAGSVAVVAGEVGKTPGLPIWDGAEKSTPTLVSTKNRHHGVNVCAPITECVDEAIFNRT
jgi:hypothetical protein